MKRAALVLPIALALSACPPDRPTIDEDDLEGKDEVVVPRQDIDLVPEFIDNTENGALCRRLDEIRVRVTNQGTVDVSSEVTVTMQVGDATPTTATPPIESLAAGASEERTMTAPDTVPAGDYNVVVRVAANVAETDTANNEIGFFCIG
ncbi:MAG: CARDB domain-containing protein [Erythrobacter sp.]|uniref:CARDB domain-containing protein n=1 Tax=Erythrobacter sp. TaxID=1042 RepID=UPI002634206C|nr:CARDB domain-containing protein [Erythrobacter sp.]MDJ0978047.1 CARDB domain-containing protein [Erythrobacter sp.]